jgi:uncharacterized protein YjbI with pentapeptide repeats
MNQKKTCKHKLCDRETFNKNDDYCIFHSKDIEGKKNQFNEAFDKEFKLQDQERDDFQFIYFIFPNDFDYFKENTIKKNICFDDATFKGEADFWGATFEREAYFGEATFEGKAYFWGATFEGEAYFGRATFKGEAVFWGATFERKAYFGGATFEGKAYFWGATFEKKAYFREATFEGEAGFSKAIFKGEAYFEVESINYNKLNLGDTFFYDLHGLLDQVEEEIKNNKLDNIYYINKFKTTSNNKILSKLKNWFINRFRITKFVNNQINPTLGERTTKRYPIIARTINDDNYLIRFKIKHPKLFFFWWFFSDCGRSIFRWAFCSMIFAFLFGLIYSNITLAFRSPPNVFTPFYYSIVTFTTLGFGDVIPTNFWGEFWVTFEVILGYVMLGGLISIFANKIARRS